MRGTKNLYAADREEFEAIKLREMEAEKYRTAWEEAKIRAGATESSISSTPLGGGLSATMKTPKATRAAYKDMVAEEARIGTLHVKQLIDESGNNAVIIPATLFSELLDHVKSLEKAVMEMYTPPLTTSGYHITPLISDEAMEKLTKMKVKSYV